jgi:phosphatidylglycerophosphate synthase
MNSKALIPNGISALRIAALPLFLYFNSLGLPSFCLLVFVLAAGTDLIDGYIARKLNVASKKGAYFDAVTDFALVMGIFAAFTLNGYYNVWLLLLIAGSFIQFAVTGYFGKRLYDPLGKYIGSILYIGITLTLLAPTALVFLIVQAGVFTFIATSFITRMFSLVDLTKKSLIALQPKIPQPNPKTATKKP